MFKPPGSTVINKPPPLNCGSANVIYVVTCARCPKGNYVGETSTPFRLRGNYHKSTFRDNTVGFPVAEHFNLPGHGIKDMICTHIESGSGPQRLDERGNSSGCSNFELTRWVRTSI